MGNSLWEGGGFAARATVSSVILAKPDVEWMLTSLDNEIRNTRELKLEMFKHNMKCILLREKR